MKPLTLEEIRLKEEMKERCLNKGQYVDENAKAKFYMLCHLENFEVQYWELQKENKQLKDNWNRLKEYIKEEGFEIKTKEYGSLDVISKDVIIEKIQELEQGSENGG